MDKPYPLSIRNDRPLPKKYSGNVYVWDIDKTYLSTRFSTWRGLARVPVEFAIDKTAIPGMPEVLRGLRRGPSARVQCLPLYFISASPPFLRSVVEHKMLLDGVEHDGITFKDWWRTLRQWRPGRLFEQLGFKCAALFAGRLERVWAREYLFGDDYERDPTAFSLYAAWVNGRIGMKKLESALVSEKVPRDDAKKIRDLAARLPAARGRVGKIYIHLEGNSEPAAFRKFGKILVPVRGAYQLALALFQEGLIDAAVVRAAAAAVKAVPQYRFGNLEEMRKDALARGLIRKAKIRHEMTP
ncbi:MAG TPA: hypothetical protein DF383_05175 [Deltaproteobacteria bacterium]|nr:hypothetical protein [Deltaproteobacteria bacterium]